MIVLYAVAMAAAGLIGAFAAHFAGVDPSSGAAVGLPLGILTAYVLARPFGPDEDGAHE